MIKNIFSSYPAFHYSKLFHDISQRTNKHYGLEEGRWVDGPGFHYSDILSSMTGKIPTLPPVAYATPAVIDSFIYLNITSIVFFMLGWYCDHVVSSVRRILLNFIDTIMTFSIWDKSFRIEEHKRVLCFS